MSQQDMVAFQGGQLATRFQALAAAGLSMDELGEGIRGSYAIVGIKGGRFHVKYKGNDQIITTQDLQGNVIPAGSIEVVIVKANGFLNKQFYKGQYTEGSNAKPDCYSLDGKVPSNQVSDPVFARCDLCPMNQFGSKISDDGKKTKACRDTKKLAVVPLADIMNETMGGAMLFRVPPSGLSEISALADAMKGRGYPYNSVAVRIGFDTTVSHPKPTFKAIRPLTDDEAEKVFTMLSSDGVNRVLADNDVVAELGPQAVAPTPDNGPGAFEQEPDGQGPAAAIQPVQQAQPQQEAPTRIVAPTPAPPVKGQSGFVIQPAGPGNAPPPPSSLGAFTRDPSAPVPQAAAGAMSPEARAKRAAPPKAVAPAPTPSPTVQQQAPASGPQQGSLDADIASVLSGLSNFTGGAK